MHPIVNIAIAAAREAGSYILRNSDRLDRIKTSSKLHHEVVSEVDINSEQIIIEHIRKAYPEHGILGEESGSLPGTEDVTWIIDPLDGTNNYLHGFPHYCVSIAVKVKNRLEHGVIFDPSRQECFSASRGQGAILNDRKIRVSKQNELLKALLGTGFPSKNPRLEDSYFNKFIALSSETTSIRRTGSIALELAYVAAGRLDGFFGFASRPWDIAAGALLIKEAGGLVGDFAAGDNFLKTGNIVAANPKLFKEIIKNLQTSQKEIDASK